MLYKDVYLRCYIKPRNKYQNNVMIQCSEPKNYSKNKIFLNQKFRIMKNVLVLDIYCNILPRSQPKQ